MEFNADDFKKIQYNVYALPANKTCLKTWPELNRFPEYTTPSLSGIDKDFALRYVLLLYDKKTPLLNEKNLIKRKETAVEMAGFKRQKDGKFDENVQAIMRGENKFINRMAIRCCRGQGMKFSLFTAGIEAYYENIYQITNNDKEDDAKDSKEKSELFEKSNKMAEHLEKLAEEVFNDDLDLIEEAAEVAEEESGRIASYPEWISNKKSEHAGE